MKNLNSIAFAFLFFAVEALALQLIWNYAAVPVFEVNKMLFGQAVLLLAGVSILFRKLSALPRIDARLNEIANLMITSEQNSAIKFGAIAEFLVHITSKKPPVEVELPKE